MKGGSFFLLLFFYFLPWNNYHDVQFAQFELSQTDQSFALKITVEEKALFTLSKDFARMDSFEQLAEINDYLQLTTQWVINDEPLVVCDYTFLLKEGHFLIEGHSENAHKEVESLSFINEFLIDEIPNHMNIIHFNLNEQLRSFKMDKSRQKISLVFD
jgi:hypothetical protein